MEALQVTNWSALASELPGGYQNIVVASINDHVIRLAVMTEPYYWHLHPNSDETFIGLEGVLLLEVEDQRVELRAGDSFTVPQGILHRTSPVGQRSVNLTIERAVTISVRGDTDRL